MKSLVSIGLLSALVFPLALKMGVTINFIANQAYISENLCENRDKPELHCGGTCIFMKKLKLTEHKPVKKDVPVEIMSFKLASFLLPSRFADKPVLQLIKNAKPLIQLDEKLDDPFIGNIFRPPSFQA
ncbi:MAG TPA: hypothetical protein DCG19_12605 [Cryomorphaceae bacterium]|nr:hypothetical protein [Owenweeksia sp.]MBF98915.1 hypothetical protein [Owenweeksia sp.]HAD98242.1 hypothetical protein [Cryomorphaceae bacterium]HBF20522.1 hypothetical protein [Cryomorphaceae bacterium]|tara:strand:+ start:1304 stop:1687 length:384 start_codon:yes stop_codon:yes gene_type:complete